jgi:sulfur carrier protein ThiS
MSARFSLRPPTPIAPQPERVKVEADTLAELLHQAGYKIKQIVAALNINHRTATRRLQYPETLTIAELLKLAELLAIPEQELIDLVREEVSRRPMDAA